MGVDWTKLVDCFLINEFTAKDLKKMFLVYGRRNIDRIEFGCPPQRWVKIIYGRESDEGKLTEAVQSSEQKVNQE